MKIAIVAATQSPINPRATRWLNITNRLFGRFVRFYINAEHSALPQDFTFQAVNMRGHLFDFSRYHDALRAEALKEDVVVLFNDTLGAGRKFSLFLYVFLLLSVLRILFTKRVFAGPFDRDGNVCWICPYVIVGKRRDLLALNFVDWERAKNSLSQETQSYLHDWLQKGWRQAKRASFEQHETKLKTLMLERRLLSDEQLAGMIKFSKFHPLRILNSVFG